jgi:hypothetical protein
VRLPIHIVRFLETDPPISHEFEIREAAPISSAGGKMEVVIFAFGKSKRPPHFVYTRESAQKSLAAFDGAKVYANRGSDDFGHKAAARKDTPDIVGVLTHPVVTEKDFRATLNVLPSGKWFSDNVAHAEANNLPMPYELSIDASGKAYKAMYEGENLIHADVFDRASLDVVERGAAGGKILRMVASDNNGGNTMNIKALLTALFTLVYPKFLEAEKIDLVAIDENELYTKLLEADKVQPRLHLPEGSKPDAKALNEKLTAIREALGTDAAATKMREAIDAALKSKPPTAGKIEFDENAFKTSVTDPMAKRMEELEKQASAGVLSVKLSESKLAVPLATLIREEYQGKVFKEADLDASIKRLKEASAKMMESAVNNAGMDIRPGTDQRDKVEAGLTGFFFQNNRYPFKKDDAEETKKLFGGVPAFKSFKEAYIQLTGDVDVSGIAPRSFRESLSSADWTSVVLNALNKRLVRDYNMINLDTWRSFVDIVPLSDFKSQTRIRFGGYPNLPIRAERAPYLPLTSPTDEKVQYTPQTRGGTEDITREMVMNDDVGAISGIPGRLARAAAQTLHEFVYEFIKPATNPTIYDTLTLYHATHANTGTVALAADGVALYAAQLRVKKQAMKDNAKRLGLRPGFLIVPGELTQIAYGLLTPAFNLANQVPTYLQQIGITPITVDYWTDATDWVIVARPEDVVGLEIGFINGQDTPQTFVSDLPNVGSFFTNDVITYKIRHEYGGAIKDFRAFEGEVVAG